MQVYNPMIGPEAEWWLSLDEYEQIAAVQQYHEEEGVEVPDIQAHSILHAVVENQIAEGKELPTEAVLRRLISENLDRHDAIHAIASVLARHMYDLLSDKSNALSNDEYYSALKGLTAEKWLRGDYG